MPAALARSPPSKTRAALESFQRALETGDLLDVLAPEVVLIADGGVKQAGGIVMDWRSAAQRML
jgi:hypothetical protein